MLFFKDCRVFLRALIKKLIERSPLKYKVVHAVSCLDPINFFENAVFSKRMLNELLDTLTSNNLIHIEVAESALTEFNTFLHNSEKFKEYIIVTKTLL